MDEHFTKVGLLGTLGHMRITSGIFVVDSTRGLFLEIPAENPRKNSACDCTPRVVIAKPSF